MWVQDSGFGVHSLELRLAFWFLVQAERALIYHITPAMTACPGCRGKASIKDVCSAYTK